MTPPAPPAAGLLDALVAHDATRPRLTWYDDAPGPTAGERIELSARVLATWTAKAANLLVDELDVQRGDVVRLALPAHWRALYWTLAAWRVGAAVTFEPASSTGPSGPAAVTITDQPGTAEGPGLVALSLPALSRGWTGPPLPRGAVDEAAELATQGDVFEAFDPPTPADLALLGPGRARTAAELGALVRAAADDQGWSAGERVLVPTTPDQRGPDAWPALRCVLSAWSVQGSAVLCRDAPADRLAARTAAERVTSACDPTGRPASRS